ncbi:MAG: efflux RND transporter periplasmic adaptor subunit [Rhodobacteraceae bacterium]|nr:efflux RND transporter periplasmic adaptor subunit [Paracoccaceae bacterium]
MNYQDTHDPKPEPIAASHAPVSRGRMTRAFVVTGLILVLVLGALVGFNIFRNNAMKAFFASNRPAPLAVNTEVVAAGEFPRILTAIGSVAAVNWVTISPEADGRVDAFTFVPGGEVRQGDVLVQLNDSTEQADLNNYRAQQKLADATLRRMRELKKQGAASQAQLDQAQSQFDVATAAIARVEALIAKKTVRAPFDGILGLRQIEVGQYLKAGETIVTLTNIDNLYVEFTLPEQAQPRLALGQTVELTVDAFPDRTFTALIAVIDPQIDMGTRAIRLQAVIENTDRALRPGMFANLKVMLPPQTDIITLPETALEYSLYGSTVYVANDGPAGENGQPMYQAKRTTVTTGNRHDGRIAITSGLKSGDRVVTTGLIKLFDGSQILLNDQPTLTTPNEIPIP